MKGMSGTQFIDGGMHRGAASFGKRFGDIPNATADQVLFSFRMPTGELRDPSADFRKKISSFELQEVIVYARNGIMKGREMVM